MENKFGIFGEIDKILLNENGTVTTIDSERNVFDYIKSKRTEQEVELLEKLASVGMELAQYASYSEIIGAIGHNREHIKKWCEEVFRHHRELVKLKDNQECT